MSEKRADYNKKFQNYLWDVIRDHYKHDSCKTDKEHSEVRK